MDQKQVKESVRKGEYFQDAREWYAAKYLQPISMRAQFIVLTVLIIIATAISVYTMQRSFVSMAMPFSIYAKDQVELYPLLKKLARRTEPLEISVARYFVSKYVELRESYNYVDFMEENKDTLMIKVQALSSRRIFKEYTTSLDPEENINSPIILYKNQVRRSVEVTGVEFKKVDGALDSAVVNFTAIEQSKDSSTQKRYKADIHFMISDIANVSEGKEKLSFLVTSYKIYQL